MKRNSVKTVSSLLFFGVLAGSSYAQNSATIVDFQVPGAQDTLPYGVNNFGATTGVSHSGSLDSQGFVRNGCGELTSFSVPGITALQVVGSKINNAGDVEGFWRYASAGPPGIDQGGYVRASDGTFINVNVPGASDTIIAGINDKRDVMGTYNNGGTVAGFVKTAAGPYQSFAVPGLDFFPNEINNEDVIVGAAWVSLSPGILRAVIRDPNGEVIFFDGPSSTTFSAAQGINDNGQITGISGSNGFLRDADGTLTAFSVAGATSTNPGHIDAEGKISGTWSDAAGGQHGFVRGVDGKFTKLDVNIVDIGLTIFGIQGVNTLGEMSGYYVDANGEHGFLSVPFGHADCVTTNGNTSVAFIGLDTHTQGAWIGTYGSGGYIIPGGSSAPIDSANISVVQSFPYVWAGLTSDPRALQISGGGGGMASAFTAYHGQSFSININAYGATPRRVAFYLLDWDGTSRAETITITDGSTGRVYDTRSFSGFQNGEYAIWDLKGNFNVEVTPTAGPSVAVSGIFVF